MAPYVGNLSLRRESSQIFTKFYSASSELFPSLPNEATLLWASIREGSAYYPVFEVSYVRRTIGIVVELHWSPLETVDLLAFPPFFAEGFSPTRGSTQKLFGISFADELSDLLNSSTLGLGVFSDHFFECEALTVVDDIPSPSIHIPITTEVSILGFATVHLPSVSAI